MDGLHIASLNVRGLRGNKRFNIYRWIKDNEFDICFVQESYCTEDFTSVMHKGWQGEIIHSCSNSMHAKVFACYLRKV